MKCRPGCGACCIAPSISSPIPGLPDGKPAGIPCIHLTIDFACQIFGDPDRPAVCESFQPDPDLCGHDREQALTQIEYLEVIT